MNAQKSARWTALLTLLASSGLLAAPAHNVILVTVDGLRWQEVFRGADERLLRDERFTPKDTKAHSTHQTAGAERARAELMPFFWGVIAAQGAVLGNRDEGSRMRVTNPWWFSYPGYNEVLTGRADPAVDSNDKRWNSNVTVLEWLGRREDFSGRVLAYGSWDAFPYIVNSERSGLRVNAGFMPESGTPTERRSWLNVLQAQLPKPWSTVRHDAITHQFAREAMRVDQPRLLYIAYGETDDFAHEGKYAQYLDAAQRFDGFLADLWRSVQADDAYRDRTVLIITTDHGRGELPLETWQHHSSAQALRNSPESLAKYPQGIVGSDHIWAAAIGPAIEARGLVIPKEEARQSQIAGTVLRALGLQSADYSPQCDAAIGELFVRSAR